MRSGCTFRNSIISAEWELEFYDKFIFMNSKLHIFAFYSERSVLAFIDMILDCLLYMLWNCQVNLTEFTYSNLIFGTLKYRVLLGVCLSGAWTWLEMCCTDLDYIWCMYRWIRILISELVIIRTLDIRIIIGCD